MDTIVMTGATRGIGAAALRRVAASGRETTLVVLARDARDVTEVTAEIDDRPDVHVVEADLSSMAATAAAANRVAQLVTAGAVPPVAALVLNAGVQRVDATGESIDGLETTFAVNVVANHILVRALAPRVRPEGRLVITVSDTHFGDLRHNLGMVPGPRWRAPALLARPGTLPDPHTVRAGRTAYSTSKLAAIHQVHEYARQYPEITVLAFNPGLVPGTGLARHADPISRFAMTRVLPLLARTPVASTVDHAGRCLAALTVSTPPQVSGGYVDLDRPELSSAESYDPQREQDLVAYLDDLTEPLNAPRP